MDSTGFGKSASLYRVTGFSPNSQDPLRGTITIASGDYASATGFVINSPNQGLRSPLIKNAWLIPISPFEFNTLLTLPKFNFSTGSNIAVRNEVSATENAYALNIFVGMRFVMASGGFKTFTVTAIDGSTGNLTLDTTSVVNLTGHRIQQLEYYGGAVRHSGHIKNMYIDDNFMSGGHHGVSGTGSFGKAFRRHRDIPTNVYIRGNTIRNMWMNVEEFMTNFIMSPLTLSSFSVTKGDEFINIVNPANYKIVSKNLSGAGNENLFTRTSTTDANVSYTNSLAVGDVLFFFNLRGLYQITNIPNQADFNTIPQIQLKRYNTVSETVESGGIQNTASGITTFRRLLNNELGTNESIGKLEITDNELAYTIRNNAGYHLSAGGGITIIDRNNMKISGRTHLEVNGELLRVTNNTFESRVWQGEEEIPGIVSTGTGVASQGAGAIGLINGGDIEISSNGFNFIQPFKYKHNQSTAITLASSAVMVSDQENLKIERNTFDGVSGYVVFCSFIKSIGGVNYPSVWWKNYTLRGNTFNCKLFNFSTYMSYILGLNTIIEDNTFNYETPYQYDRMFLEDTPNPELIPEGDYKLLTQRNNFNRVTQWGTSVIYDNPSIDIISEGKGSSSFTGNGILTDFTVTHNGGTKPKQVIITPTSIAATEKFYISARTSTTFTVKFITPPVSGSSGNISFDWIVK